MPVYDYRCSACDHLVEVIHGINDPGPRFCESCGADGTMRKGLTTPAVLFKGTGWARKDRPGRAGSGSKSADADPGSTDGTASAPGAGSAAPSAGVAPPASAGSDD